MPANMTLEIEGLQALQRKLARVGDFRPVIELVEETTKFVEEEAERGARGDVPPNVGKLGTGDNIRQQVEAFSPGGPFGKVFTRSPIVVEVDQGRKPGGRMPPIALMAIWATRHGIDARRGFYLARAIARQGSKGVKFFAKAEEAGSRRIRELAPGAARGIAQEFRR